MCFSSLLVSVDLAHLPGACLRKDRSVCVCLCVCETERIECACVCRPTVCLCVKEYWGRNDAHSSASSSTVSHQSHAASNPDVQQQDYSPHRSLLSWFVCLCVCLYVFESVCVWVCDCWLNEKGWLCVCVCVCLHINVCERRCVWETGNTPFVVRSCNSVRTECRSSSPQIYQNRREFPWSECR